jgi:hypothetical protein
MGNDLNKDKDVQVYLALDKSMTYAGEIVTGAVHINCIKDRQYRTLDLVIKGEEKVGWYAYYGQNNHQYFFNSKDTYFEELKVTDFDNGIRSGHYSFPFSLLLPAAFPSSLKESSDNIIRYEISAVIRRFDNDSEDQVFKRELHIREPYRGPPKYLSGQSKKESSCCNCLCGCGHCTMTM